MLKREKGFTLIELMIVVAIIGILAAIAIPKFVELMCKSKDGAMAGDLGSLRSAVVAYYARTDGTFPCNGTTQTLQQDLDEADILSLRRFPVCKPGRPDSEIDGTRSSVVEYVDDGDPIVAGPTEGGWAYDSNDGVIYPDYGDMNCVNTKAYSVF